MMYNYELKTSLAHSSFEAVQRPFTRRIDGLRLMTYRERDWIS